jgi:hypothetical protein
MHKHKLFIDEASENVSFRYCHVSTFYKTKIAIYRCYGFKECRENGHLGYCHVSTFYKQRLQLEMLADRQVEMDIRCCPAFTCFRQSTHKPANGRAYRNGHLDIVKYFTLYLKKILHREKILWKFCE